MGGIARVPAEVVRLARPAARLRLALRHEGLTDAEGGALLKAEADRAGAYVARYWGPGDAIPVPSWLQDE